MNSPDGQNVYVIEHEHGYVKIGVSDNPTQRVSDLQTGSPYELNVLGVVETDEPFAVEARLHERFDQRRTNGEWFNLTTRQRRALLRLCDLGSDAVYWRYSTSAEERKRKTMKLQGLIG